MRTAMSSLNIITFLFLALKLWILPSIVSNSINLLYFFHNSSNFQLALVIGYLVANYWNGIHAEQKSCLQKLYLYKNGFVVNFKTKLKITVVELNFIGCIHIFLIHNSVMENWMLVLILKSKKKFTQGQKYNIGLTENTDFTLSHFYPFPRTFTWEDAGNCLPRVKFQGCVCVSRIKNWFSFLTACVMGITLRIHHWVWLINGHVFLCWSEEKDLKKGSLNIYLWRPWSLYVKLKLHHYVHL